ncbi:hypothetical protein FRC10_001893 [Ceratobasidium sp. 414]|nr:hypothetical protein FRC10_001893 [Ceratobasidium sp. 414]
MLDPTINQVHTSSATIPSLEAIQVTLSDDLVVSINPNNPAIHRARCLVSRATTVLDVVSTSSRTKGINLIAKLTWPNTDRENEIVIVQKACGTTGNLAKHLPRAFGSQDLGQGTEEIRTKLGISKNSPRSPRILRIIIFEKLYPLTDLRGEQLLTTWVHCVRCHHAAWERVHHQDLSLKNLMYRKEGAEVFGVVNDWDLSYVVGGPKNTQDLTATIPFLSLQVLAYLARNQPIDRCYYHDLESFIWALLRVFFFVQGGQVDRNDDYLKRLETGDIRACLAEKSGLLTCLGYGTFGPREEWGKLWPVGSELIRWMGQYGKLEERGDDGPLFESFIKAVVRSRPDGYTVPTTPST